MQSLLFFLKETHPTEKDLRQMIHPSGQLLLSFWWPYFFFFHHTKSVWTHRSLRLWWRQLLSLSNPLFSVDCLLQGSRMMLFVSHKDTLHVFQACSQVFYHPSPLCSHKLLLQQHPFSPLKIFEANKIESWIENDTEKNIYHFHLGLI